MPREETRVVTILSDDADIPKGEYHIQEMYCTDKNCECRKVNFNVIGPNNEIYYLDYGFELPEYYIQWGIGDEEMAKDLSGLSVNTYIGNPIESQKMFNTMEWVLQDKLYVDRLKRHYKLMKEKVKGFVDPVPFGVDDLKESITYLNEEDGEIYYPKILTKKTTKERKKKKMAKKQRKKGKK